MLLCIYNNQAFVDVGARALCASLRSVFFFVVFALESWIVFQHGRLMQFSIYATWNEEWTKHSPATTIFNSNRNNMRWSVDCLNGQSLSCFLSFLLFPQIRRRPHSILQICTILCPNYMCALQLNKLLENNILYLINRNWTRRPTRAKAHQRRTERCNECVADK